MKLIFTFIAITFLLIPLRAQEKVYTVDNLPKVHLQNKMQYVCNPAGILSKAACDSIDSMLYALELQTGIETVVAVVPSIGEEDCFDFCHQLLNQWGVGKKDKNNGLVILLVTDQRCIQFYTGYGLEGVLPDAICKRIQTKYMIPYLKDGNWNAGMVAGLKATCQVLDGSMENDSISGSTNNGGSFDFILAIFFFILIGGGIAFLSARKKLHQIPPEFSNPENSLPIDRLPTRKKQNSQPRNVTQSCSQSNHRVHGMSSCKNQPDRSPSPHSGTWL